MVHAAFVDRGESIDSVFEAQVVPFTVAASCALLVFDYLCTLDQEIHYIWSTPFTIGSVLFIFNRYLPFIDSFMSLHLLTSPVSPETCLMEYKAITWLIVLGTIIAEGIFQYYLEWSLLKSHSNSDAAHVRDMGTQAFDPRRPFRAFREDTSLDYTSPPPGLTGCFFAHSPSNIIFVAYVLLVVSETTIFALTVARAVHHLRRSCESWIYKLYQDGVLFYMYLLAMSLANVIVPLVAPHYLSNWLATPQHVLHSLLCNRAILFILHRSDAARDNASSPESSKVPQVFTSIARMATSEASQEDIYLVTSKYDSM